MNAVNPFFPEAKRKKRFSATATTVKACLLPCEKTQPAIICDAEITRGSEALL